jgi:hypothetical protein
MRGRHDAHVDLHPVLATDATQRSRFEYTQEPDLHFGSCLAKLVQEQGASVRELEEPLAPLCRARERPSLVAEELALERALGQGTTALCQKRPVRAIAGVIADPSVWMESEALTQLTRVASHPACVRAAGMPDLHPGRGIPIGAAFQLEGTVLPDLVGGDAGCGVLLIAGHKDGPRGDALERRLLASLEEPGLPHVDSGALLRTSWERGPSGLASLEGVPDVLAELAATLTDDGRSLTGAEVDAYLADLRGAVRFARTNRLLVALRLLRAAGLGSAARVGAMFDIVHNAVEPRSDGSYLHRKGAAPAERAQPTVVLGSRGAPSWVMEGLGNERCLCCVAHGAGRRIGSRVICDDTTLMYEEHPEAYNSTSTAPNRPCGCCIVRRGCRCASRASARNIRTKPVHSPRWPKPWPRARRPSSPAMRKLGVRVPVTSSADARSPPGAPSAARSNAPMPPERPMRPEMLEVGATRLTSCDGPRRTRCRAS